MPERAHLYQVLTDAQGNVLFDASVRILYQRFSDGSGNIFPDQPFDRTIYDSYDPNDLDSAVILPNVLVCENGVVDIWTDNEEFLQLAVTPAGGGSEFRINALMTHRPDRTPHFPLGVTRARLYFTDPDVVDGNLLQSAGSLEQEWILNSTAFDYNLDADYPTLLPPYDGDNSQVLTTTGDFALGTLAAVEQCFCVVRFIIDIAFMDGPAPGMVLFRPFPGEPYLRLPVQHGKVGSVESLSATERDFIHAVYTFTPRVLDKFTPHLLWPEGAVVGTLGSAIQTGPATLTIDVSRTYPNSFGSGSDGGST